MKKCCGIMFRKDALSYGDYLQAGLACLALGLSLEEMHPREKGALQGAGWAELSIEEAMRRVLEVPLLSMACVSCGQGWRT